MLPSYKIEAADILQGDPHWNWDTGGYSGKPFLLWLIAEGKGTLEAGGDFFNLGPGDCIISPLWQPHRGRHNPEKRLTILWACFNYCSDAGKIIVPDPLPAKHRRVLQRDFICSLMQRMITAFKTSNQREARLWLSAVFCEIALADTQARLPGAQQRQNAALGALADAIKEQPHLPWNLTAISRRLALSPDHCVRIFKRFLGTTPHEFIIRCRLDAAGNLLLFSDLSISAIAEKLGFCDVHYFSRQFTARTGQSPLRFRKKGLFSA